MSFEMILEPALTIASTAIGAILTPLASTIGYFMLLPAETTAVGMGIIGLTTYCDSKAKLRRKRK
jgi:hypothetical protein